MDDLVRWLGEQLDTDERLARLMEEHYPSPWDMSDRGWMAHVVADAPGFREVVRLETWHGEPDDISLGEIIRHVAVWDPARVLREIDAKRQRIAIHTGPHECASYDYVSKEINTCQWVDGDEACTTLRLETIPYVARPGYRAEWAPNT